MSLFSGRIVKTVLQLHRRRASRAKEMPIDTQLETLIKLLEKAAHTAFGQYYQFSEILQSDDIIKSFQERVPIHDYDRIFDTWWSRVLAEEEDVVWPGKTQYFALSSGTSDDTTKYIPVTDDMLTAMQRTSRYMFAKSTQLGLKSSFYGRKFLMLGSSTDLTKKGSLIIGDVSGINVSRVPFLLPRLYKPGKKIARTRDWEQRIEAIAESAKDWDICTVAGSPSWVQLMMERVISYHQVNNIHDIWPNFQVYVSGGVAFGPYKKRFEQLCGKPLIYLDTLYTSEGCLACQTRLDNDNMPMELVLNNSVFFEFVPFNEQHFQDGNLLSTAKALSIDEVEEEVDYAILLSTCSGAWRYLLGDTVRFFNKELAEIKITGRTKHFLSICGEHLSVDNMNAGIEAMEALFDLTIPEFTVKAVKVDNHFEHHWYIGTDKTIVDTSFFAQKLDEKLASLNDDYATERRDNLLKFIKVHAFPEAWFVEWLKRRGKSGGQAKFPRVMRDEVYAEWLGFLKSKGV